MMKEITRGGSNTKPGGGTIVSRDRGSIGGI